MKRAALLLLLFGFASGEIRFPLSHQGRPVFFHPKGIHTWKGKIYVSDRKDYSIKVFSEKGKFLFQFGGKGEGPGLFKRWFGVFNISPQGLIIQGDYWGGNRFLNVFNSQGKFLRTITVKFPAPFAVEDLHAGGAGEIILGLSHGFKSKRKGGIVFIGSHLDYYLMEKDGKLRKIHGDLMYHSFSYSEKGRNYTVPYQIYYLSAYNPKLHLLALCRNDRTTILVFNLRTMKAKEIKTGWKEKEVTEALLKERIKFWTGASWMDPRGKKLYQKLRPSNLPHPHLPVMDSLLFTPEGSILAVKSSPEGKVKLREFSLDGKLLSEAEEVAYPFSITSSKVYLVDCTEDLCYVLVKRRKEP